MCLCQCLHKEMEPTLSGKEQVTKPISLAKHHCVIKNGNYSSPIGVKARALLRHSVPFIIPNIKTRKLFVLGRAWEFCPSAKGGFADQPFGCCGLVASPIWAWLDITCLGPLHLPGRKVSPAARTIGAQVVLGVTRRLWPTELELIPLWPHGLFPSSTEDSAH